MTNSDNSDLTLQVGDYVRILSGKTGRIEAIEGEELQIALDSGATVFKAAYAVDLVPANSDLQK